MPAQSTAAPLAATLGAEEGAMRTQIGLGLLAMGLAWGLPGPALAEGIAVGDTLAAITLEDQHGAAGGVDAATRGVLLTRDMDGGGLVREALAADGAAQLARAGAVYIADVHRMPGPIRRFIALPRMRERPYPVLLDTEGKATAALPSAEGRAIWLRLDALRVAEIRLLGSAEEVRAVLTVSPEGGGAQNP
jgi:hypothetical protein